MTKEHKADISKEFLAGLKISVQGVGKVGYELCRRLNKDGVKLYISNRSQGAAEKAVKDFNAVAVGIDEIYDLEVDVFSPCAVGGALNKKTIPRLKTAIIAGSANNQLSQMSDIHLLEKRDILYSPDFVINAGGVINLSMELVKGGYDRKAAYRKISAIYDTLLSIFERAKAKHKTTVEIAYKMAEKNFRK